MISALSPDPSSIEDLEPMPVASESARSEPRALGAVGRRLVGGTSALGLAILIERGSSFAANILAARIGGAATFGAYSLAISTANNIATYAGAGIGSTATRFSGKYGFGSSNYGVLARVLTVIALISAAAAAAGLWLGAAPIAGLLRQPHLIGLLAWTGLSAAGIILLECARGFFVGQHRLPALLLLSVMVAVGMLSLLPLAAAHHSPVQMITSQGAITLGAVLLCLLLARPLGLWPGQGRADRRPFSEMLREIWGFGFVQLAGLIGTNAAGWWLMTLVARSDRSLVQMGFFGIASQLRNIVGLAPGLLTEASFAVMADPEGEANQTPQYVLARTTFASSLISFLLAAFGILMAPWMLRLLYTSAYTHATIAVSIALALAVMHMGNSPAAARLSIVSIRSVAVINSIWAIFVAAAGSLLMFRGGSAALAMLIYLAAHALSSVLVLLTLSRKDSLPAGMAFCFGVATMGAAALAGIAVLRALHPASGLMLTGLMLVLLLTILASLVSLGRHYGWVPSRAALGRTATYGKTSVTQILGRRSHGA